MWGRPKRDNVNTGQTDVHWLTVCVCVCVCVYAGDWWLVTLALSHVVMMVFIPCFVQLLEKQSGWYRDRFWGVIRLEYYMAVTCLMTHHVWAWTTSQIPRASCEPGGLDEATGTSVSCGRAGHETPLTSHCLKQLISLTWALLLTYDTWYSLKSACLKRRLWLCGDVLVCSAKKAEMLVKALRQTLSDFCRDRSLKRLSFNEEQIHKFDKWVQSEGLVSVAVHRKHLVSVCSVSSASDDVKTWVCFCHDYSVPSVLSVRAAIAVRVTFLNFVAPRR